MSIRELIDIFAIALGAGLMLIAIRRAWGMRSAVQSAGYCHLLRVLLVLMKLFFVGYLFGLWAIVANHTDWLQAVLAQFFFFGSIFVVLTIWLAQRTTAQIQKYSQHLEQLVAERTEHLQRALQEEERAKRYLAQLFHGMPVACFTYDREGVAQEWNEEAERLYGFRAEEAIGKSIFELICCPEDVERTQEVIRQVFAGQAVRNIEWLNHTRDGEVKWVLCSTFPLMDKDGSVVGAISANVDITARKEQERLIEAQRDELEAQNENLQQITQRLAQVNLALEQMAAIDALTELPNHRVFRERLWREFLWSLKHDAPLSLVLLDVDQFKQLNDTFGHQAGDEVLRKVATVLREQCGDAFFPARYGGEEFVVILPGADVGKGMDFAQSLRRAVEDTLCCYQPITVSLGVSTVALHTLNPESLIEEADQALYASKRNGRNRATHASDAGVLITEIAADVWTERVQNALRDGGGFAAHQLISQIVYDHLQMLRRAKARFARVNTAELAVEEACRFQTWWELAQDSGCTDWTDLEELLHQHQRFHDLYQRLYREPDPQRLNELLHSGRALIEAFQHRLAVLQRAA